MTLLEQEMRTALEFGKMIIRSGHEFSPLMLVMKEGEHMFLGSPGTATPEDKDKALMMMAMAARAWGGDEIVFLCDSLFLKLGPGEEPHTMPSEDPRATDAIVVSAFRPDGDDLGILAAYHYTPEGIVFDEDEELPPGDPGKPQGLIPMVMHTCLSMTDEQVSRILESAPVPGGLHSVDELFTTMSGMGFLVLQD